MNLVSILQNIGLNEKQAKVYLACLELGGGAVLEIAKKAEIKRPTCYVILEELQEKQLVTYIAKNNKTHFTAQQPTKLMFHVEQSKKELEGALPFLEVLNATTKDKPQVRMFTGKKGVMEVYKEIMQEPTEATFCFAPIHVLGEKFQDLLEFFTQSVQKNNIRIRMILPQYKEDIEWSRMFASQTKQVRFLPTTLYFAIDFVVYENKVCIFSYKEEVFTTVIESKQVTSSFQTLFELAWQSAIPADEIFKRGNVPPHIPSRL